MSIHVKIFNSYAVILINEGEQNMQWDKIELASRMQNYIREHCMDEDFSMMRCMRPPVIPKGTPAVFSRSFFIRRRRNMYGPYR